MEGGPSKSKHVVYGCPPTHLVKNGHLFAGRCRTIISFRIPISNTRAYSIVQKATATVQIDIAHKLTC